MSLSINNNVLSLVAQRKLNEHTTEASKLIARLSSGTRIGGAGDDPAGQAVAARMSSNLKGMSQAMRNINDAGSLLQVADSAMANIGDSLQRLRELAVTSGNGSYTDADRNTLQQEANQILSQITQVGNQTSFNGQAVFAADDASIGGDARRRNVLDGLKTGWLGVAEDMVKRYYGIEGKDSTLTVNVSQDSAPGGELASVSGNAGAMTLNIYMNNFGDATTPDGGGAPQYSDRIIAHEMTHAVMMSATNIGSQPGWFIEGTAELLQGADERLKIDIGNAGGVANLVGAFDTTYKYAGGYAASRYLHDQLKENGVAGGIKGVMQYMSQNAGSTLDQALGAVSNGKYADVAAFEADFRANGTEYINTRMNLANDDTGAIGGLDADGGPSRNAREVVQDAGSTDPDKPLRHFKVVMPDNGSGNTGIKRVQVQAGSNAGDLIELQFSAMNARALGLADVDMKNAPVALLRIDQAIDFVDRQRAVAGASSNRLDMAVANVQTGATNLEAARGRIEDVDYATSTAKLTRAQILQQAASAMMTQANGEPRAVLALLR